MTPRQPDAWFDDELPPLNVAILAGDLPAEALAARARAEVLPRLPSVDALTPAYARQLVVRLGLFGASVARHWQERTPDGVKEPERAFDGLAAGAGAVPFRDYFAALAEHTGDGHYGRDSFASLVRWNVGTMRVRRGDEVLAVLPGVFDDGRIRSYTGTAGEEHFFLLVKYGEALELAVNEALAPLSADGANLVGEDAVARVRLATDLIAALRQSFLDFIALPPEQSMPPEQFMDVFRQFAAHWVPGDIPPSGARRASSSAPATRGSRRRRSRRPSCSRAGSASTAR